MRLKGEWSPKTQPIEASPAGAVGRALIERPHRGGWIQWHSPEIEWNIAHLPVAGLPEALEGLRIAHLTDFHVRPFWHPRFDELIRRLKDERPDLILFTGDFVDHKRNHVPALPNLYRLLKELKAPLGCFAILGNHDTHRLRPRLAGTNITLIDEGRVLLKVHPAPESGRAGEGVIELIGLPGVHRTNLTQHFLDSIPARESTEPGTLRIVMAHFPDHMRKIQSLHADLLLSGHTHGGQCCLPGMIPIIKHDSLPRRISHGVHRIDKTWMVISRGLGTTGVHLRVFCPPEVIEIRLVREAGENVKRKT